MRVIVAMRDGRKEEARGKKKVPSIMPKKKLPLRGKTKNRKLTEKALVPGGRERSSLPVLAMKRQRPENDSKPSLSPARKNARSIHHAKAEEKGPLRPMSSRVKGGATHNVASGTRKNIHRKDDCSAAHFLSLLSEPFQSRAPREKKSTHSRLKEISIELEEKTHSHLFS